VCNADSLAGAAETSLASTVPEDDFNATLSMNLNGVAVCCQAAVPLMRNAGGGKIVNVSSEYAMRARRRVRSLRNSKSGNHLPHDFPGRRSGPVRNKRERDCASLKLTSMTISELGDREGYNSANIVALRRWGKAEIA
jgi:NAD(P)-dependent dehydrogenase (short-subunit alcohol dehydrogenase family)